MRTLSLDDATPQISGGKAATLATLRRAGIDVPDGFVIPISEYRHHHTTGAPGPAIRRLEQGLIDDIGAQLLHLSGSAGDGYVAVRSSSGDEDGRLTSWAGQHDTVLAVRGVDAVVAAVLHCWSSLHSARADAYRRQSSHSDSTLPAMAVLVQRFVDADASGVLFTQTPRVVEATPGLGAPLVSGHLTPDAWTLDGTGIVSRRPGHIRGRLDRHSQQLLTTPLPAQEEMCLHDAEVYALDRLGQRISRVLAYDADVEWAIIGHRIHTLQARPITEPVDHPNSESTAPKASENDGIAASPGRAAGTARVLEGPRDFHRLVPGDIIICRTTDPAWTPLFRQAAGIITETGGLLSHAAIVARELRIPAILSVPHATTRFPDGTPITIDGTSGLIRERA